VKRIQVYSNKGPGPLQRGDNHKNVKMRWGLFKNHLLKNYEARKAKICMKVCSNHGPWGSGGATIREFFFFTCADKGNILKRSSQQEPTGPNLHKSFQT
jgi:hypothetical protein